MRKHQGQHMKELIRPRSKFVLIPSLFPTTPTWHFHVHELHAYIFEIKANRMPPHPPCTLHQSFFNYIQLKEKKQIATLNLNIETPYCINGKYGNKTIVLLKWVNIKSHLTLEHNEKGGIKLCKKIQKCSG